MRMTLHRIERIIDKIIPYTLVLLLLVIILELGFHDLVVAKNLQGMLDFADYTIILIFLVDLAFKYNRVRDTPRFMRKYWLEIIAVFPFFLFFRLAEWALELREISGGIKTAQSVTHTAAEIPREIQLVQDGERMLRIERSSRLSRFLRPLLRIPRFLRQIPEMIHFFDEPHKKA